MLSDPHHLSHPHLGSHCPLLYPAKMTLTLKMMAGISCSVLTWFFHLLNKPIHPSAMMWQDQKLKPHCCLNRLKPSFMSVSVPGEGLLPTGMGIALLGIKLKEASNCWLYWQNQQSHWLVAWHGHESHHQLVVVEFLTWWDSFCWMRRDKRSVPVWAKCS